MQINDQLQLDENEITYEFSRSSGPGGQNVNKVESRVTIVFPVATSQSLSDDQRQLLLAKLAPRLTKEGVLRLSSQENRTREANRRAVRERLAEILAEGLVEEAQRVPTKTPKAVERRRLEDKKRRGRVKASRSRDYASEDF